MITAVKPAVAEIAAELQCLQRERAQALKSRNMNANRLQAIVAGTMGYSSGASEAERKKMFGEAGKLIKAIAAGEESPRIASLVRTSLIGIEAFDDMKTQLEKQMVKLAKQLPAAAWVEQPEQRGFGMLFLAIVVGETGDLNNYANPGKVWRRLGCAPFSKDGETLMGATWRSRAGSKGTTKLHALDWEEFGYSPRRRSIAYLIGEGIVKQNGEGPYRKRYDEKKAEYQQKNPDYSALRCHRHGMLLATKMLLKHLWIEWRRDATILMQPNADLTTRAAAIQKAARKRSRAPFEVAAE